MTFGEWWDKEGFRKAESMAQESGLDPRNFYALKDFTEKVWSEAEEEALEEAGIKVQDLLGKQEKGIHRVLKTLALAFWTLNPRAVKAGQWLDERIDSLSHSQGLGLSSHEQAAVKEAAEQDDWKEDPVFDYDTPDIPF